MGLLPMEGSTVKMTEAARAEDAKPRTPAKTDTIAASRKPDRAGSVSASPDARMILRDLDRRLMGFTDGWTDNPLGAARTLSRDGPSGRHSVGA